MIIDEQAPWCYLLECKSTIPAILSGSQILDIQKKNYLRAGCGWNVQQMGSQKQGERPLSYAMCAQDASLG